MVSAFRLAPRLNAATRMGRSDLSVALVTARDPNEAARLAGLLDEANKNRQAAERELLAELEPLLAEQPLDEPVLLSSERWNTGLLGLVAGRVSRERGLPVVLISSLQGDPAKGSCRSVPGFDAHAALAACDEHLETHGGHPGAAGFSIRTDALPAFREAFFEQWQEQTADDAGVQPKTYESEVLLSSLTPKLVKAIDSLEPFGKSNPRPSLVTGGVLLREARQMGNDGQHLALTVAQGDAVMRAVAFSRGHWADQLPSGSLIDVLYTPKFNHFRGRTTVELEIQDVRPSRIS